MRQSDQIEQLAAALAVAQGSFEPIKRSTAAKIKGETSAGKEYDYTYHYADLASVIASVRDALSKNSICVVQPVSLVEGRCVITTRLIHSSGQWMEDDYEVGVYQKPQAQGSAITYGKRYALQSFVVVAAEGEDDDGVGAQRETREPRPPREDLPPCPRCGSTDSVMRSKYDDGFYCNKKARKPGCGHSWGGAKEAAFDAAVEESKKASDAEPQREPGEDDGEPSAGQQCPRCGPRGMIGTASDGVTAFCKNCRQSV